MLRLVNTAEGEGWEAVWRPDLDITPESAGNWDAVALDADFGTAAFQAPQGIGLRMIAVIGWWDQREIELGPLCAGFLHRPLRPAEVVALLASIAEPTRMATRRG